MPITGRLMPVTSVSRKKLPASASESRFEMVMVRRSLEAAKAIRAGNSKSLIISVSMIESFLHAHKGGAGPSYAGQTCISVSARNLYRS